MSLQENSIEKPTVLMTYNNAQLMNAIEVIAFILIGVQILMYFFGPESGLIAERIGAYIMFYIWLQVLANFDVFNHNCWWKSEEEKILNEMYRTGE